jgi:hypothetical protein
MRLALVAKLECSILTPHPLYKSPYLVLKVKHLFQMFGESEEQCSHFKLTHIVIKDTTQYQGVQGARDGEVIYSRIMRFIYYIGWSTLLYVRT